jgi:hypothetical protein
MKTYELEIEHDDDPMNPRVDWDNVTTMICFHRNYNLGDKHDYKKDNFGSWEELKEQIESDHKVLMIKPLRLYDHSGITISTSNSYPFNDRFDSMMVGWIFIDESQIEKMCGKDFDRSEEKLSSIIEGEVEDYDKYLCGDVYQYTIYEVETCSLGHKHKVLLESCGGFFGEDYCEQEGKSHLEYYENELKKVN